MAACLSQEKVWDKSRYANAERQYYELMSKGSSSANPTNILVSEIAKAREQIKISLEKMGGISDAGSCQIQSEILSRLAQLEDENSKLKSLVASLNGLCLDSQKRIKALEATLCNKSAGAATSKPAPAAKESKKSDDDDGVDLFASDSEEESEEAARIREERLAAYAKKKEKKPALIAKSSLVLDIKPWDDETDLGEMEAEIRKITTDGLLWGASKLVPVAFGIKKLSISCVVEDDKVSIDWLTEEIEKHEDFVQSVDIAAFNKI
ncbi:probable elongation factor 1-delta [Stomoxys calcitrans]|uniref:Translation elongation factor EF1B beta/delta subunit guanine nucleotide exchange domain-containing protein n=1 Tax=Stomoxys calcitrans TaxID=35570 RepID=A0A1I8Q3R3_STOCA|nr:probable elongation factor 1-delta [Stomoxys calcitrans]